MSGGVDSTVAAWLLKERGFLCTGATMKLYSDERVANDAVHCVSDAVRSARDAANQIGIPLRIFDFTCAFDKDVITRFTGAYKNGSTPNPCVDCNKYIKFGRLLDATPESGSDYLATGHYSRIERVNGRYLLMKGVDRSKDQSYVLYTLTQDKLAKVIFPLGGMTKSEVRGIALELGVAIANSRDSQDICFLPRGNYSGFIESRSGEGLKPGNFVDADGVRLGTHRGIHRYTIGQRRGLGIASGEPLYVCAIDPEENTVVLGPRSGLFSKVLIARDINLIPFDSIAAPMKVRAKIRYGQTEQPATVRQLDDDTIRVEFDEAQRAVTRGQSVVLYDGDIVVGGGTIC